MTKRRIHIDSLSLRLPHSARGSARGLAASIGREILVELAETTRDGTGKMRVDAISLNVKDAARAPREIAKKFEQGGHK